MRRLALCALLATTQGACVSKVHYDRCVSDAAAAAVRADARAQQDAARIRDLEQGLATAQAAEQDRDARLSDLSTASHNVQSQLDEATAINAQLRAELERLGRDVDKMLAERGTLSKALDDAKLRLVELRRAQDAAEKRVALFRDLGQRFKPLADAGQVALQTKQGRLLVVIQGDLLFEPGRSEIRSAGKGLLMEMAHAFQSMPAASGRHLLVVAHVDERDPKDRHAKSPWELTSARSVAVVEYLVSLGLSPSTLVAGAAGASDPVAPNDTPANRSKNRRIEVEIVPGPEEIVPVPSADASATPR